MDTCFAVDKTLGKLAKWLRILGYDTIYEVDVASQWFFEQLGEDRILVTRTAKLKKKFAYHKVIIITSNYLIDQLKQVIEVMAIEPKDIRPFSRCLCCNLPIIDVNKNDVYNQVPNYIWETQDKFYRCGRCDRIYWPGSHTERTHEKIERIFHSK